MLGGDHVGVSVTSELNPCPPAMAGGQVARLLGVSSMPRITGRNGSGLIAVDRPARRSTAQRRRPAEASPACTGWGSAIASPAAKIEVPAHCACPWGLTRMKPCSPSGMPRTHRPSSWGGAITRSTLRCWLAFGLVSRLTGVGDLRVSGLDHLDACLREQLGRRLRWRSGRTLPAGCPRGSRSSSPTRYPCRTRVPPSLAPAHTAAAARPCARERTNAGPGYSRPRYSWMRPCRVSSRRRSSIVSACLWRARWGGRRARARARRTRSSPPPWCARSAVGVHHGQARRRAASHQRPRRSAR